MKVEDFTQRSIREGIGMMEWFDDKWRVFGGSKVWE